MERSIQYHQIVDATRQFLKEQGFDKWKIDLVLISLDGAYSFGRIDSLDKRLHNSSKSQRQHSKETKDKISESMKKSWEERKST